MAWTQNEEYWICWIGNSESLSCEMQMVRVSEFLRFLLFLLVLVDFTVSLRLHAHTKAHCYF